MVSWRSFFFFAPCLIGVVGCFKSGKLSEQKSSYHREADRQVLVRVRTEVGVGSGLDFRALQQAAKVNVGESVVLRFEAVNLLAEEAHLFAELNTLPIEAGKYLSYQDCFCDFYVTLQSKAPKILEMKLVVDENWPDIDYLTFSITAGLRPFDTH